MLSAGGVGLSTQSSSERPWVRPVAWSPLPKLHGAETTPSLLAAVSPGAGTCSVNTGYPGRGGPWGREAAGSRQEERRPRCSWIFLLYLWLCHHKEGRWAVLGLCMHRRVEGMCGFEAGGGGGTVTFVGSAETACAWPAGTGGSPHAGASASASARLGRRSQHASPQGTAGSREALASSGQAGPGCPG